MPPRGIRRPILPALAGTVLLLMFQIRPVHAQSQGAIVGTVRDPSGSVIAGAGVTVTNIGTSAKFTIETSDTGQYYVPSLIPGQYRVEIQKVGFQNTIVSPVTVEVSETTRVDVDLKLGRTVQTVKVDAPAPLVQTESAALGRVITSNEVMSLPLNGRDYTTLLRLNTGVTELQGGAAASSGIRHHGLDDSFRSVSVDGARPSSIGYLIDGVTANDAQFEISSVTPPIDAIQEFRIENGLYSAEYGMGAAQVSVALRSGTNDLHGSAWDFLRNDDLQPENPYFHTKTPLKQNQFGFTVGGPIVIPRVYSGRNRTFFFASYEGGLRRTGTIGLGQVPTDQEKQGNFSDWPVQLYNPLTGVPNPNGTPQVIRQPFPNNIIPVSMFAPVAQKLLQYFPSPNITCTLPCNNYQAAIPRPVNTYLYSARIDQQIGENDRLFGQFIHQQENAAQPALLPLSGNKVNQNGALAGLQETHIFSPRTLNEFRLG